MAEAQQVKSVVLLSQTRTGSHALKAVLRNHPEIYAFPESLLRTREHVSKPYSLYFYLDRIRNGSTPDTMDFKAWVPDYLSYLSSLSKPARIQLIDWKLHELEVFGGWNPKESQSGLLDYLTLNHYPIIHLERINLFRKYLSEELAKSNDIWHIDQQTETELVSITIDCQHLIRQLHTYLDLSRMVQNKCPDPAIFNCQYENFFNGNLEDELTRIYDWLGVGFVAKSKTWCKKQNPFPMARMVNNFEEVCIALKKNNFENYLSPESDY